MQNKLREVKDSFKIFVLEIREYFEGENGGEAPFEKIMVDLSCESKRHESLVMKTNK
jgi:hypothetical protein